MLRGARQVTCGTILTYGTTVYTNQDGYCDEMAGCKGKTYADRKVDLLQLGFRNVTVETFANCKSKTEIDRRARSIILS